MPLEASRRTGDMQTPREGSGCGGRTPAFPEEGLLRAGWCWVHGRDGGRGRGSGTHPLERRRSPGQHQCVRSLWQSWRRFLVLGVGLLKCLSPQLKTESDPGLRLTLVSILAPGARRRNVDEAETGRVPQRPGRSERRPLLSSGSRAGGSGLRTAARGQPQPVRFVPK